MVYNRGNPNDYDAWARITKDDSWKYENLLRFFKKSEAYHGVYASDRYLYNDT
jgi:choline dehydrogenase